jgi:Lrp/AsnC family leucine-responsive transcriptional regulator
MNREPDIIDYKILQIKQFNASLAQEDIAALVSRTPGAVSNRLQRMKRDKYILGYKAILNGPLLGFSIYGFAEGRLNISSSKFLNTLRADLTAIKGITECLLSNHYQRFYIKIAARNLAAFHDTVAKINTLAYLVIDASELYTEILIPDKGLQLLP